MHSTCALNDNPALTPFNKPFFVSTSNAQSIENETILKCCRVVLLSILGVDGVQVRLYNNARQPLTCFSKLSWKL